VGILGTNEKAFCTLQAFPLGFGENVGGDPEHQGAVRPVSADGCPPTQWLPGLPCLPTGKPLFPADGSGPRV